jgi:hypothetical protein
MQKKNLKKYGMKYRFSATKFEVRLLMPARFRASLSIYQLDIGIHP